MALVAVTMDCLTGCRFTDSLGGCNSFAYAIIGTDPRWLADKFSMMCRFKLASVGGARRFRIGPATSIGTFYRFRLSCEIDGSNFLLHGIIDSDAGFSDFTASPVADLNEHSVAWTYDKTGIQNLYYDGVLVNTGASPGLSVAGGEAVDDIFMIAGSSQFTGVEEYNLDRVIYTNAIMPSSQILDIHTNCSSF
jgi:hypothetical protein